MSRMAQLKQSLSKGAGKPEIPNPEDLDDEQDDDELPEEKTKEAEMADNVELNAAVEAARKEGHAAGAKEANDRMSAVFASEHYAGREAAAVKLLGKNMSSDDIIDVLADMPKASKSELSEEEIKKAAEDGGRKEMKDALAETENSNIDAGANGGGAPKADANSIWDQAISANNPGIKLG